MQPSTHTILRMAGTLTVSARFVVLTAAFVLTAVAHSQITWYVDDDNCPEPGSGTLADPFCSIQVAINAAINGDEVVVAIGTYVELINFSGKAITVRSTEPNDPGVVINTVIDGNGLGTVVTCTSGEGSNSVLQGFTITGGTGTGDTFTFGGGMLNRGSSPTVTNCTFSGNTAGGGGGMFNAGSSSTVTNCIFSLNTASFGGGMLNHGSSPTVTNCTFLNNRASIHHGGGMSNESSRPTVTGCEFTGNSANTRGGGMFNRNSVPTVTNCTFSLNTADKGGGMHNDRGHTTVTNCVFSGNSANFSGGGMYNYTFSGPTVTNCTFSGDTLAGGRGNAIWNLSNSPSATLTNCVVWNFSGLSQIVGRMIIRYSVVSNAGTGNIYADPMFVDPENGDFRLLPGSPCIDAGYNWRVAQDASDLDADGNTNELIPFDLDGNSRFNADPAEFDPGCGVPVVVDMGAYEFQGTPATVKLGDIDGDGVVAVPDLLTLLAAWGPTGGGCQLADFDLDGIVGMPDLLILLANWR